jgi:hypothetical protein
MRWIVMSVSIAVILVATVPILKRIAPVLDAARGTASPPESPAPQAGKSTTTLKVPTTVTVYRWRDAKGTLHLESAPPPMGVEHEVLTMRGEKRVEVERDGSGSAAGSEATDLGSNPLSVYTPAGSDELMKRLDDTLERMQEQQHQMQELEQQL